MAVQSADDKAKAEAQAKVETQAAKQGAQAVAEAVKRVADEAVNAAAKQAALSQFDFVVTGQPGGKFECFGRGNPVGFSSGGTVFVSGRGQETYEWGNTYIRGRLDADVKSGEVIVQIDSETKRSGYLNLGGVPPVVVEHVAPKEGPAPGPAGPSIVK